MSADLQDEQTLLFRDIVIICIHYQLFPSSLSHVRRSDIKRRGMYRKLFCCFCRAPKPPIDEVVSWRQSLKKLQESKTGQLAFREFLRTEYSEENILFWLACEEYKTITTSNEIAIAAKRIYTEFVQVDAPRQEAMYSRRINHLPPLQHTIFPPHTDLHKDIHLASSTCKHRHN
ncbi:regulator of G-protein signaling 20-like isoform X3 [Salvelinus alpinus]|uniref:regulator of G-protein signaling 20-like isoform X3 n=1 Tax=Salvelinus alpinus TaxID=8036 RepID=UPI0039FBBB9B